MPATSVLVLGCGDVGSAVAHRLFRAGARVVLCDLPEPSHSRRGMAYTDALFNGTAVLEDVAARHVADLDAIRALWSAGGAIPVVTLPEDDLAVALRVDAVVDAIMRRHAMPPDRRALAATVVGLGPGFTPGINCHVAVETQWGDAMGSVLRDRATAALSGGPKPLAGIGHERFVSAGVSGRWCTSAAIGQDVAADEIVGTIAGTPVRAPLGGRLRGLPRDGVMVIAGQKLVEVDPRAAPRVFGLGARPRAAALGVCRALGLEAEG
ncbi:MAG: hypothetical protein JSR59_24690 [Proteobacteria bacterium]|nr:hypothetical protein [Pseudomonadota bacterium]